jgi:hypothetical protein
MKHVNVTIKGVGAKVILGHVSVSGDANANVKVRT